MTPVRLDVIVSSAAPSVSAVTSLALKMVLFSHKCCNVEFPKTAGPPAKPSGLELCNISLLTVEN